MNKKTYSGINIQWPISQDILSGKKTIETRTYPIPSKYLNKEMLLIETPGKRGRFKARIVGIITFTECFKYKSKQDFYDQLHLHLVSPESDWAWKDKAKYGWKVKLLKRFETPIPSPSKKGIKFTNNIKI